MTNEWDEYAEGWDTDPSVQEYANKAFAELHSVIVLDGLEVLDFGCGTGSLTEILSSRVQHIVALDGSSEMIKLLANKNLSNVSTIPGFLSQDMIESHTCLSKKFDLIVASSVCGFLPDYEMTLILLKSLLRNGGMFVQWDWLSDSDSPGMGLSEDRIIHALKAIEFTEVQVKTPFEMNTPKGTMKVVMAMAKHP